MNLKNDLDGQGVAKIATDAARLLDGPVRIYDAHTAGRIVLEDDGHGNVPEAKAVAAMMDAFQTWGRAPVTYCVVIDSKLPGLFSSGYRIAAHASETRLALANTYKLTWLLDCFTKPTIALIDGRVGGAGAGLSLYGTHKVAAEGYRFSMPGPSIGWFPDHGTTHVLAALPDKIGLYLALTGRGLARGDALDLGLITQCIDAAHFSTITRALSDADPVDPLLDDLHTDGGARELAPWKDVIARCFSAGSVEGILERLANEETDARAWAATVMHDLAQCSPLALKITFRLMQDAGALDLRETLKLDYRIASRLLSGFDGTPHRRSGEASLAAVGAAAVDRYFEPLVDDELTLLTRAQMQAAGP